MAANDKSREFFEQIASTLTKGEINTEIIKAKIASKITLRRKELNMNQGEFARFMNVSQGMVSRWENGDCNFSLSTICDICDKLSLVLEIQIKKEEDYRSVRPNNEWDEPTKQNSGISNFREGNKYAEAA